MHVSQSTQSTDVSWLPSSSICREGNGTPLQSSCLENPMDGGAWWAAVHGVAKSQTWLSNFTFTFHFHSLEKEMATHSGVLAWRIPGMGEPGGLPSMGSHRVRHDWSDLAAAAAAFSIWNNEHTLAKTFLWFSLGSPLTPNPLSPCSIAFCLSFLRFPKQSTEDWLAYERFVFSQFWS